MRHNPNSVGDLIAKRNFKGNNSDQKDENRSYTREIVLEKRGTTDFNHLADDVIIDSSSSIGIQ